MNPKISVIVPIYNTEKYLSNCLDSILNQTYKNLEIILIDDGSTDNSGKIADNYAKKDQRIKVIHQKNAGQSSARNSGIKKATGEYLSFIDSDDEIKPNFMEKLLTPYTENPETSLVVCGILRKFLKTGQTETLYLSPSRQQNTKNFKTFILSLLAKDGRLYSSVNKLYRAKIAKNLTFDTSLQFAEDTKFVLDYLKKTPGKIDFTLEPLYTYNFGSESSTINQSSLNWQNWQKSYQNLKAWVGENPSFTEKFWLRTILLRWRISYYRSKNRAKKSN
ncbi:glycosyltransferase family 2 protein [Candidatus Saccharibacteria bacterium]|nr:glycosyltransferase family 2 protein [Candidatus Saccharibacteria bacterium]